MAGIKIQIIIIFAKKKLVNVEPYLLINIAKGDKEDTKSKKTHNNFISGHIFVINNLIYVPSFPGDKQRVRS